MGLAPGSHRRNPNGVAVDFQPIVRNVAYGNIGLEGKTALRLLQLSVAEVTRSKLNFPA